MFSRWGCGLYLYPGLLSVRRMCLDNGSITTDVVEEPLPNGFARLLMWRATFLNTSLRLGSPSAQQLFDYFLQVRAWLTPQTNMQSTHPTREYACGADFCNNVRSNVRAIGLTYVLVQEAVETSVCANLCWSHVGITTQDFLPSTPRS